jgi:signal transduction histidine kinase
MIPNAPLPIRGSLLFRLLVALLAALALGLAALFVGLDHFVSGHFSRLRTEQIERTSAEVQRLMATEGERLVSLAVLLAKEADLNHSTFYHLFLAGERAHPQSAVERIAKSFGLEAVSLWDEFGREIAVSPAPTFGGENAPRELTPNSQIIKAAQRAWLVADAPLLREGKPIAILRIARPMEKVLETTLPTLYPASLRVVEQVPAGAVAIDLAPVTLALALPDTVGEALAGAKTVLAVILVGGGLALGGFLVFYLRWQLKPLTALADAAGAIGRGDFAQRVSTQVPGEMAKLAEAFNAMAANLEHLRELERKLAHQEQLSAIGRVAARVAHDINNPLTVITNTAQLALKPPPADAELAEDLRRIVHHGERCMRTLELLLDYGRPVRVQSANFDLAITLAEFGARWKAAVSAPASLPIHADRMQLEQMLDNLLTNARDASGTEGEVRIVLEAVEGKAQISVIDSGPGFSAAARERLFEPFHTTKSGGTGLGLASALAIARAHGGDIAIGAGPGGYVTVILPLGEGQARPKVPAPL